MNFWNLKFKYFILSVRNGKKSTIAINIKAMKWAQNLGTFQANLKLRKEDSELYVMALGEAMHRSLRVFLRSYDGNCCGLNILV